MLNIFKKTIFKSVLHFNIFMTLVAIASALFTTTILKWVPCPMCIMQQASVLGVFIVSLIGLFTINQSTIYRLIKILIIAIILFGLYIACDQIYYQYFATAPAPVDAGSCDIVKNQFVLNTTQFITGTIGNCRAVEYTIVGLSLAVYSAIFFTILLIGNLLSFFKGCIYKNGKK